MRLLEYLVRSIVLPNLKAWVGVIVGAGVAWLAQLGVETSDGDVNALVVGLSGLATGLLVWLFPNKE